MINAFYTAASGASGAQSGIDVSANNIANVNTTGFKEQNTSFSEILNINMANTDGATPQNLMTGSGVILSNVENTFDQGDVTVTGHNLDVAIKGEGFFGTMDKKGNVSYTRAGNFSVDNENGTNYLVTSDGDYVLDSNSKPIVLSNPISSVEFSAPTAATATDSTIKLGLFIFSNPYALTLQGGNKYSTNALSGKAVLTTDAGIKQGSLEASTVDLAAEMTKIIQAQRSFQLNAKIVTVADEIEQMANSMRS